MTPLFHVSSLLPLVGRAEAERSAPQLLISEGFIDA